MQRMDLNKQSHITEHLNHTNRKKIRIKKYDFILIKNSNHFRYQFKFQH